MNLPRANPASTLQAAIKSARVVVERLLEREKDNNGGKYPETIALVLWGTDNIKTYGESLAQVMMMVGIRPVSDSLGRVNKLEVMSLEELGRPRIDVVVNCSGVFRDLFVNQMLLLDRAVKMAAELDEPDSMNFVRKHAREQMAELGLATMREAATRIFSNSSGSYSSNVNLAVENSSWSDEAQLQARAGFGGPPAVPPPPLPAAVPSLRRLRPLPASLHPLHPQLTSNPLQPHPPKPRQAGDVHEAQVLRLQLGPPRRRR